MKAKQTLIAEAKMIIRKGNWTDHDASGWMFCGCDVLTGGRIKVTRNRTPY